MEMPCLPQGPCPWIHGSFPGALDMTQVPWECSVSLSLFKNSIINPIYICLINDVPKSCVPDTHAVHLSVVLFRAGLTGQPPATEAKLPQNTNNTPQHSVEQSHNYILM